MRRANGGRHSIHTLPSQQIGGLSRNVSTNIDEKSTREETYDLSNYMIVIEQNTRLKEIYVIRVIKSIF